MRIEDLTVEQLCHQYTAGSAQVANAQYRERLADLKSDEQEGTTLMKRAVAEIERRIAGAK